MPGKVCIITTVHHLFDTRIFHKEAITLASAGYELTLIAQHDKNEVIDGINIIALPKSRNRFYRILLLGWKAYKLALKQNADVYHFHDPEFLPWANRLKKKTKAKVIYDVHEDYITSIKQRKYIPFIFRNLLSAIFNYIEKHYSNKLFKILAEKYYEERFPEGLVILNYPLVSEISKKATDYSLMLDKHRHNRAIYTGNVSEDRGALFHADLVKLIPSLHVYIIGKCNQELIKQMYERAGSAKDRLYIDGEKFIPFEKILSYYSIGGWLAGLAIFPYSKHYYKKELTKFFEYMNAGIPIVASNFPTWKKLIEDNNCGICVDPKDTSSIKEAIIFLIEHPDKAKLMGQNGKKLIKEKYNWELESKKLLNLYKKFS